MTCTDNKNTEKSIIHAPINGNPGTNPKLTFWNCASRLPGELSAAQFIAQTIGVPAEHITMILNAAPAHDREDLILRAEALRRCRERT